MRAVIRGAMLGLALCAAVPGFAKDDAWKARLSRVPIDSATAAKVTGIGHVTAELDGGKLEIMGDFEGLQGAATGGELHEGPVTGARGETVAQFSVPHQAAGSVSASLELTPEQLEALRAGRLYVQINSESAPDGNLWGWLLP
jgi:hypothetical protein